MGESLHPGELPLRCRVVLFTAVVPLLVRLKLSTLERLLEPTRVAPDAEPATVRHIVTCVEWVLRAFAPAIRQTCLTRGLTRYYFLRRAGLEVTLCFGIGPVRNDFAGHCWLTHNGEPFLETTDPRPLFTAMYTIPRR